VEPRIVRSFRTPSLAIPFLLLCIPSGFEARAQPELVIHKEGTALYHRADCAEIRNGKNVMALTRAQAEARGLKSHPACDPSRVDPDIAASAKSGEALPVLFVRVDDSKYYHRDTCPALQKDSKRVELESAGRTHWPCPKCRPPVRKKRVEPAIPKRTERG
jgi:hypothetical protein